RAAGRSSRAHLQSVRHPLSSAGCAPAFFGRAWRRHRSLLPRAATSSGVFRGSWLSTRRPACCRGCRPGVARAANLSRADRRGSAIRRPAPRGLLCPMRTVSFPLVRGGHGSGSSLFIVAALVAAPYIAWLIFEESWRTLVFISLVALSPIALRWPISVAFG